MLSKRDIDKLAGVLFILIFVTFDTGITLFGGANIDSARDEIRDSLQEVIDDQEIFVTRIAFFLAASLVLVAASAALYLLFSPHGRPLALFGLVGLMTSGVWLAIDQMAQFSLLYLARDFVDGVVASPDSLVSVARAIAAVSSPSYNTSLTLLGLGVLSTGVLIVRARAAPDWLGWLAVVSGIFLLMTFSLASGVDSIRIVRLIGVLGTLFFFLFLGIWLLRTGSPEAVPE